MDANMKLVLHESHQLNRQILASKIRLLVWFSGILVVAYMLVYGLHAVDILSKKALEISDTLLTLGLGLAMVAILLSFVMHFISKKQLATHTLMCDNQHLLYLKNDKLCLKIPITDIHKLRFGQIRQTVSGGQTQTNVVFEALSIDYLLNNKQKTQHINTSFVPNKAEVKQFVNDMNNTYLK